VSTNSPAIAHGRTIGEQLRGVRQALDLSLLDVERLSAHAMRASVLGAYERNERAITLARAAQLAEVYGISLQVLLFATPVAPVPRADRFELVEVA